jgi:hypothetical protein
MYSLQPNVIYRDLSLVVRAFYNLSGTVCRICAPPPTVCGAEAEAAADSPTHRHPAKMQQSPKSVEDGPKSSTLD